MISKRMQQPIRIPPGNPGETGPNSRNFRKKASTPLPGNQAREKLGKYLLVCLLDAVFRQGLHYLKYII
jgi:hypothetical protein